MSYLPKLSRLTLATIAAAAAHGSAHTATRSWVDAAGANRTAIYSWSGNVVPLNGDDALVTTAVTAMLNATCATSGLMSSTTDNGASSHQTATTSAPSP